MTAVSVHYPCAPAHADEAPVATQAQGQTTPRRFTYAGELGSKESGSSNG